MLKSARELLKEDESLLVILTDGHQLNLDATDGDASTAWWRMAEKRNTDKVVIYHRKLSNDGAAIYKADFVRKERRESDGRFKIYLTRVDYLGETSSSWSQFANDGQSLQSPLRYLSA